MAVNWVRFTGGKMKELMAFIMWKLGFRLNFSTGAIDDELTAGYGKLDDWGYWQFPLSRKYVLKIENRWLRKKVGENHNDS